MSEPTPSRKRRAWDIVLGVFLISGLLVAIGTLVGPHLFGIQLVVVEGQSMEPTYEQGDLIVIDDSEPTVGDIAVYEHPQIGPVVHRIIGGDADGYVLRGDNNPVDDPYLPTRDEVVGVVRVHIPDAGHWTRVGGLAFVAVGIAVVVSTYEPRSRKAERTVPIPAPDVEP